MNTLKQHRHARLHLFVCRVRMQHITLFSVWVKYQFIYVYVVVVWLLAFDVNVFLFVCSI